MMRITKLLLTTLAMGFLFLQVSNAQCVQLGTTIGELTPTLKTNSGFCPTPAQTVATCDCPAGFVAVGYTGLEGNSYGAMVLSQFSLRCRQLNSDGSLGATIVTTCANGSAAGATADGPIDAAAGQALVGAEYRIGCAVDALIGRSKPILDIAAGSPNTTNTTMTAIGGTGGSPVAPMYAPTGNVIVGMRTYIDPGNNISAGVAWRYAPITTCPLVCSINAVTISNVSVCNNNGTPSNANDDTFTANVTVTFTAAPTTGTLNLTGDGAASVAASSLVGSSHTFSGVSMAADGSVINLTAAFSADAACSLNNPNAGTAPTACSVAPVCSVQSISVSNISVCNNNGTPANAADDFFTGNVTVTFFNPPASGNLVLTGNGSGQISVASISGGSYTFSGVSMPANGLPINLTAFFNNDPACTLNNPNAGSAPSSCSFSSPTIPTMSEWGLIIFGLMIFSLTVVFGTQLQQSLSMGGGSSMSTPVAGRKLPFDRQLYFGILPYVLVGFAAFWAISVAFGYQLTGADVPCSLVAGAIVTYLIHFVKKSSNK